jgi:radical SAM-linked protein
MSLPEVQFRYRVRFSKTGPIRFIGHLDLQRNFERVIRRAKLPLAYSKGFHPRPKIQFAQPLPLGFSSETELLDVWFSESVSVSRLIDGFAAAAPSGLRLLEATLVAQYGTSLPALVCASQYRFALENKNLSDVQQKVSDLLAQEKIIRERRKKQYNLRPLIESLEVEEDENGQIYLKTRLTAKEGATGRPEEVLAALDETRTGPYYRLAIYLEDEKAKGEETGEGQTGS